MRGKFFIERSGSCFYRISTPLVIISDFREWKLANVLHMKLGSYLVGLLDKRYWSGPKLDDEDLNNQLNLQNISHSGKCSLEHYLIQDRSALFLHTPVGHYSSDLYFVFHTDYLYPRQLVYAMTFNTETDLRFCLWKSKILWNDFIKFERDRNWINEFGSIQRLTGK